MKKIKLFVVLLFLGMLVNVDHVNVMAHENNQTAAIVLPPSKLYREK